MEHFNTRQYSLKRVKAYIEIVKHTQGKYFSINELCELMPDTSRPSLTKYCEYLVYKNQLKLKTMQVGKYRVKASLFMACVEAYDPEELTSFISFKKEETFKRESEEKSKIILVNGARLVSFESNRMQKKLQDADKLRRAEYKSAKVFVSGNILSSGAW